MQEVLHLIVLQGFLQDFLKTLTQNLLASKINISASLMDKSIESQNELFRLA